MFNGKSVAVVVPAYNEETQIAKVIKTMPRCVDEIIIVDDGSTDNTTQVARVSENHGTPRQLIRHEQNRGVGAAIESGYRCAVEQGHDLIAVMAGDGQMRPDDLAELLRPVAAGEADYAKANRLSHVSSWRQIPRIRLFGNLCLSLATQAATGLWGVWDSQAGYTVISRDAARSLLKEGIYPRYGCPNDILVKLAALGHPVVDVPQEPVYHVGEVSKLSVRRVTVSIPMLLARGAAWRMQRRYLKSRTLGVPALFAGAAAATLVSAFTRSAPGLGVATALFAGAVSLDARTTRSHRSRPAAVPASPPRTEGAAAAFTTTPDLLERRADARSREAAVVSS